MDALYHYCPTNSFTHIVNSRSIWLSSLTLSNDSMEGKIIRDAMIRLGKRDQLKTDTLQKIETGVQLLEDIFDGLGFCLSKNGDQLSQWRGYANDAAGVSIGFSKPYLQLLSNNSKNSDKSGFKLGQVEYSLEAQEAEVEKTYKEMSKLIDDGAFKFVGGIFDQRSKEEQDVEQKEVTAKVQRFYMTCLLLFPKMFLLKSPAFREEQEWRLIATSVRNVDDQCLFRPINDRVIPYKVFNLDMSGNAPITEVVLGPKHSTPPDIVKKFLEANGFGKVAVRRSLASYR